MIKKLKNTFITIRNALTLRNLLAVLCAIALIAVIVKGFRIEAKIEQVRQADAYYEQNLRIQAEVAYAAARSNTVIRYREEHIEERLTELAPITTLREELLKSKSELLAAAENRDFDTFLTAHESYDSFLQQSLTDDFAAEYKELSERYELAKTVNEGFSAFRSNFEQALASNFDTERYDDESAKWSLLRIPAMFFSPADAQKDANAELLKTETLNALFQNYDQRKLKKMAAAGRYPDMLSEASSTLKAYESHDFGAPWVLHQAEETTDTVLRKDLDAQSYAAFSGHARAFGDFVSQANLKSETTTWIDARIEELMSRARSLVTDHRFEEAIALYRSLDAYRSTDEEVTQTESAWTEAEPLRILQAEDSSLTYSLAISGKHRFGADLYVAALGDNGLLYFGTKTGDSTSVSTSASLLSGLDVQSLRIEDTLSTTAAPVIVVQSGSSSRKAVYTALMLQPGSFRQIFQIEADGYTIADGGNTLRADNPADAEEDGQTAIYERSGAGGEFYFSSLEGGTLDIGAGNPEQYPQKKVRAQLVVLSSDADQTLAQTGDGSSVLLRGVSNVTPGAYTVTGTFEGDYAEIEQESAYPSDTEVENATPESIPDPVVADESGTDFPAAEPSEEDPGASGDVNSATPENTPSDVPAAPDAESGTEPQKSFIRVPVFVVDQLNEGQ
ncbi:hypothetical protein [Saccharibacillus sacchari]|uniref:hypothetical protein n=1 Tax=Saccharibacillus sacchari TaxID=456493 RepID=UPI0004B65B3A|nr:hypothetical protein [Saccharibacillus sacchari]